MEPLSISDEVSHAERGVDLGLGQLLGRVESVESHQLKVGLSDPELITRVTLSDLVALPAGGDFLVGLVDGVTTRAAAGLDDARLEGSAAPGSRVELRIVPVGTLHPGDDTAPPGFSRGMSGYPHVGNTCHLIEGQHLRRFMSILGEGVAPGQRLVLGRFLADRESHAIADGNRFFQRHVALLGSTGTGKSWAVAHMLERAARLNHANLIVFDLHGEYGELTKSVDGGEPLARRLRVAGPGDLGRTSDDALYLPYWLLHRDELMTLVLNADDPHASDQLLRFTEHVQTLKHVTLVDAGRDDAVTTFTVDSPIPYRLNHLLMALKSDDTERIVRHPSNHVDPGPFAGHLTGFITRLEARAADPRYGFIFNPPDDTLSYSWFTETASTLLRAEGGSSGIKIIDLSEVPSSILPLVVGVLARLVFEVQFWVIPEQRTPISLVCDEAHLYLPPREKSGPIHHAALETFESIAKEGRKYGVALLVISQRPSDVSRTILSQCSNFVIMRLTNDHDRAMVERLVPETLTSMASVLPALEVGEAVVIGDALLLPTRVQFDPPVIKPTSTTQPYWSLWSEQPSHPEAIAAGVEALRNQLRAAT